MPDTYWPDRLAEREAEVCGDASPLLRAPCRSKMEAALDLVTSATIGLKLADETNMLMARNLLDAAIGELWRAAELLPPPLAAQALALAGECQEAGQLVPCFCCELAAKVSGLVAAIRAEMVS